MSNGNAIFVGDRGMVTESKYKEINHDLVKVVSALSHGGIQKLLDKGAIQMSLFDKNNIVEIVDENLRYMLCKNPVMGVKEANTRKTLLEKTTEELDKIMKSTRKTKNPKGVRAGKVVNKYKMGKFIIFDGDDDNLSYKLDQAKIEEESQLDGCYIVFTDVLPEEMSAMETVKTYKSLIQVEQAFRNLKTAALEVRPVFHKTDDRIKCHVFICMLAYYVMWHMRQRLQPLCDTDGVGADRKYTFEFMMKNLESIRLELVDFMGVQTSIVSTPNEEQTQILNLLGVAV